MTFEEAYEKVHQLFTKRLEEYQQSACQCAYPRYSQILAIDCVDTSDSFSCYETELLIELSKPYFNWSDDNQQINSQWICKKCGSAYAYEWQDFSIQVNRQVLKQISFNTPFVGKNAERPIPLFLGLSGHAFPPETEIRRASFEEFENYFMEKSR